MQHFIALIKDGNNRIYYIGRFGSSIIRRAGISGALIFDDAENAKMVANKACLENEIVEVLPFTFGEPVLFGEK